MFIDPMKKMKLLNVCVMICKHNITHQWLRCMKTQRIIIPKDPAAAPIKIENMWKSAFKAQG